MASRKRTGSVQSAIVDMIGLLVRAPRTMSELVELTGMSRESVHGWLRLLIEEGLLRKEARSRRTKGGRLFMYFWSPPFPVLPANDSSKEHPNV